MSRNQLVCRTLIAEEVGLTKKELAKSMLMLVDYIRKNDGIFDYMWKWEAFLGEFEMRKKRNDRLLK